MSGPGVTTGKLGHHQATCPTCGARVDLFADVAGGRTPQTGDVGICVECTHGFVYGPLGPREMTPNELHQWKRNPYREMMEKAAKEAKKSGVIGG